MDVVRISIFFGLAEKKLILLEIVVGILRSIELIDYIIEYVLLS